MKRIVYIALGFTAAAVIAAAVWSVVRTPRFQEAAPVNVTPSFDVSSRPEPDEVEGPLHRSDSINADTFVDPMMFDRAKRAIAVPLSGVPIAGVVNHHALASDLLLQFFRSLGGARKDIQRIVILSPDHFKGGHTPISICDVAYTTRGVRFDVDEKAIDQLMKDDVVSRADRSMCDREHGIGALLPFAATVYPNATLVPVAIRSDVDRDDAAAFGVALSAIVDAQTIVIVSSDMSHYLHEDVALKNDVTTQRWFATRDLSAVSKASDDFTDNGPSYVVLFSLFRAMKTQPTFTLINHSISSRYVADRSNTTSYLTGVWGR